MQFALLTIASFPICQTFWSFDRITLRFMKIEVGFIFRESYTDRPFGSM